MQKEKINEMWRKRIVENSLKTKLNDVNSFNEGDQQIRRRGQN